MLRTVAHVPPKGSYRTVVVGAGPAGVMAAMRASAAGPVLLVDAAPLPRHKSCGGMIHALAIRVLARHGISIGRAVREPQRVRFRYHDWDSGAKKPCSLEFWNVDRDDFDTLLLEALPGAVDVAAPCHVQSVEQDPSGCTVMLEAGGGDCTVRCELVIGADGARSRVRECIAARSKPYVTLQDALELRDPIEPFFDCVYTHRAHDCHAYSYIVPKDGHALVGSVFYPGARHPHARHDAFLTDLRERFRAFGESVSREAAAASCIRSISDLVPGRGRVLLAGEAGGFLSPTSGEGISYALGTGELAGAAATNDPDHALLAYERSLRTLKTQVRAKLAVLPLLESTAGRTMGRRLPSPIISAVTRHL